MASELISTSRANVQAMHNSAVGPQGILSSLKRKLMEQTKPKSIAPDSYDDFRLANARTNGLSIIFKFERELRCLSNIVMDSDDESMAISALALMGRKLSAAKGLTLEGIMAKHDEGDSLVRFLLSQNINPNLVSELNRACADLLPIDSQLLVGPVEPAQPGFWKISLLEEGKLSGQYSAQEVGSIRTFCKTINGKFSEQEKSLDKTPAISVDSYTYDEGKGESRVKFVSFDILLSESQVRETELGPRAHLNRMLNGVQPQIIAFRGLRQASLSFRLSSYWNEEPVLVQRALIRSEPAKLTYIFELPIESWYVKIDGSPRVIGPLEFRMN